MARRRMIDPEFWLDEKLATVSPQARLLFIGLWNICDDNYATLPDRPEWIRIQVFPYESVTIPPLLTELEKKGFIVKFTDSGSGFWFIKNFFKYQKVEKPSKAKYPKYSPTSNRLVGEDSDTTLAKEKLSKVKISEAKLKKEREYEREKTFTPRPTDSGSESKRLEEAGIRGMREALMGKKILHSFLIAFLFLKFFVTPTEAKTTITTKITIKSSHVQAPKKVVKRDTPIGKSLAAKKENTQASTSTPRVQPKQVAGGGYVEKRIREVFFEEPDRAVAISKCESGMRPEAIGYNTNGSVDQGVMQINSVHAAKFAGQDPYDLEVNLRVARQIYDAQGGFQAWSCNYKV